MAVKKAQFSKDFLQKIKENLEAEKNRIEAELSKFTKKNPNVSGDYDATFPEYGDKSDENAQEISQYLANKPLEMSLEKTLRDVEKTLARIADGVYGICKYCKEKIDERRLLARPTSGACIACKKSLTQEA